MTAATPQYVSNMTFRPISSFPTLTVVVTVTGITSMLVLPDDMLRML